MTKKKKIKVKATDFPVRQACYPYRVGQEVCAIIWDEELFAYGKIAVAHTRTVVDNPGTDCFYDIECKNGEYYMKVPERAVFLTVDDFSADVAMQLTISDTEFEEGS